MGAIIEVNNFSKVYGSFRAVDNISFEVERGSTFAFLGTNGAGKSTTINTLCTMIEKTSGTLLIDGKDVSSQKNAVRKSIGIVFQESTLDQKMTIAENLALHCILYGVPKDEIDERIHNILTLIDLSDSRDQLVSQLSGGMKRRVEIARALLHDPKVLFLDEPTTGLDPHTRNRIWEYLLRLQKERDLTIFLTTHYIDEAEVCDKIAIMDHAQIMVHASPRYLKETYTQSRASLKVKNLEKAQRLLLQENMKYVLEDSCFFIEIENLPKFLKFISFLQEDILDIEILKGNLNDVFLNITGKEIREGGNAT